MNTVKTYPADIIGVTNPRNVIDYMVEVRLKGEPGTMFRRIVETLTRVGVIPNNKKAKTLVQNCHLLHKQGKYYITHYKYMYCLDGGENRVTIHDVIRQSKIIRLLSDWDMIEVVDEDKITLPMDRTNLGDVKVVQYADREEWKLQTKYIMGQVLQAA